MQRSTPSQGSSKCDASGRSTMAQGPVLQAYVDRDASVAEQVLFVPANDGSLSEMLYVADQLAKQGAYRASFLMTTPCRDRWLDRIRRHGHELFMTPTAEQDLRHNSRHDHTVKPSADSGTPSSTSRLRDTLSFVFQQRTISLLDRSLARWLSPLNEHILHVDAARWLGQIQPRLLVTADPGDHADEVDRRMSTALLMESMQRGIPTLSLTGELWPRRFNVSSAVRTERLQPCVPMRREPQLLSCVALENRWQFDALQRLGFHSSQLRITGRASADIAYDSLRSITQQRARLCVELGLRPDREILLCDLPNISGVKITDRTSETADLRELFTIMHRVGDANVVLHVHPSSDPASIRLSAAQHRFAVAVEHPLEQLVPISDVVICGWSPALVLAMACGKPAVHLSMFSQAANALETSQGMIAASDWREAQQALRQLFRDREYRLERIDAQRRDSPPWIMFDGRSTERLLAEIRLLMRHRPQSERKAA